MKKRFLTCYTALSVLFSPCLLAAPPSNDNFANAILITGTTGTVSGTNVEATLESGENPPPSGTQSIWYRWVAPSSGVMTIDSTGSDFDTVLNVGTGLAVNSVNILASNDDSGGGFRTSLVSISVTTGTTYVISLAGYDGDSGNSVLNWKLSVPAPNDNFSAAEVITGVSGSLQSDQTISSTESGETGGGARSVWYSWTAPASGIAVFDTRGSEYDTLLGIYRGGAVNALTLESANDDWGYGIYGESWIKVNVTSGVTYRIRVAQPTTFTPPGLLTLNWKMVSVPQNDHFTNAAVITGTSGSVEGSMYAATIEEFEPNHYDDLQSIWYAWTAPFTGVVSFDTTQSGYAASLYVVNNADLNALNYISDNNDSPASCTVPVVSGNTYRICIATQPETTVKLNWQQVTNFIPSVISLTQSSFNVTEGGPTLQVTLSRNGGTTTGPVSCRLYTINESATDGEDYGGTFTQVNFADGATTAAVNVPMLQDRRFEGEELFVVRLFAPSPDAAFGLSMAKVNIADDEPFIPLKANYTGLVTIEPFDSTLVGSVKINATGKGSYTGSLAIGGNAAISFSGNFNAAGKSTFTLIRRTGGNVLVNLTYADNGNRIRTQVTVGGKTADIQSWRIIFGGSVEISEKPFAFTTNVNGLPFTNGNVPTSDGALSINVSVKGVVKIIGCLPDGSVFTSSGPIGGYDVYPLYAPLYASKGCFCGDIFLEEATQTTSSTTWFKAPNSKDKTFAGGFIQKRLADNSPYVFSKRDPILGAVMATQGSVELTANGPGLPQLGIRQIFRLLEDNSIAMPLEPQVKLTLKFVPSTGLFTGTFQRGTEIPTSFNGAVFQTLDFASGYFMAPGVGGLPSTGDVFLVPYR